MQHRRDTGILSAKKHGAAVLKKMSTKEALTNSRNLNKIHSSESHLRKQLHQLQNTIKAAFEAENI